MIESGEKMAELVYKNIISDLKEKIFAGKFTDMKLTDERSLDEQYNVSRSSVKPAINKMSNEVIVYINSELQKKNIIRDLKEKIFAGKFTDMKLPDERSLAEQYNVSRSSVKRALNKMSNEGIIFKKRGSGTFINPLYLKNESIFNYEEGSNLGISDNFRLKGKKPQTKILDFQVIKPTSELQRDLFLSPEDFVYKIIRLRLFEDKPFMIETGYIPIKILP